MTLDEIANVLGQDTVDALQAAVRKAYIAANRDTDVVKGRRALDWLLMAMAASAIGPNNPDADSRVESCCEALRGIMSASGQSGSVPPTRPH